MFETYSAPILTACFIFPFVAALFTTPYVLFQYRKYGSIPMLRVIIVYSFILYLLASYFLVILPLPSIEQVANMTTPTIQKIPFNFINDFINHTSLIISDSSTYIKAISEPCFYQAMYNLLLVLPFGIYLHYYAKCSFKKTLLLSFLLSLFFELTQLSGLYGIYPRGYRLFDVDDLIINTMGGVLGYCIVPLIEKILPTRDKLDEKAYKDGEQVTLFRRITALLLDSFIFGIIYISVTMLINISKINISDSIILIGTAAIYFIIIPYLKKGRTFGKQFLKIKLVTMQEEQPKFFQYCLRGVLLYFFLIPMPIYILVISFKYGPTLIDSSAIILMVVAILLGLYFLFIIRESIRVGLKKKYLFYEKISNIKNKSVIKWKQNETEKVILNENIETNDQ